MDGSNDSVVRHKKLLLAILLGLLTLAASPYSISFRYDLHTISIPWGSLFTLLVAMAYGWRYALMASLAGGALYPFLIWPANGWANVATFVTMLFLFLAIGIAGRPGRDRKLQNPALRYGVALLLFALVLYVGLLVMYPLLLKFNPPFWTDDALRTINSGVLRAYFVKEMINCSLLTVAADTIIRVPIVRRLLLLKSQSSYKRNNYVMAATLTGAFLVWVVIVALTAVMLDNGVVQIHDDLVLVLFVLICCSFIIARILMFYTEQHLAFKEFILLEEEKYRTLVSNIPGVVFRSKPQEPYSMIFISDAVEGLSGHQSKEFLNGSVSFDRLIHPDDQQKVHEAIDDAITQGSSFELTYRLHHQEEGWRWVFERGRPQFNLQGDVVNLDGVIMDITDQHEMQLKLRESEQRFHTALEFMAVPIGITIGEKIIFHNRMYLQTFGYTVEEVPTIGAWMLKAYPDPSYRDFGNEQWTRDVQDAIVQNTSTVPRDYRITCKNGAVKLVTIIGRQIGDVFVAVFLDITAQKAAEEALRMSEERYRRLFEMANDAIFMISNGVIIDCNPKTSEMFGYPDGILVGMTPWELSPAKQPDGMDSRGKATLLINRVLAGETVVFDWLHQRSDGSEFEAEVSLNLLPLSGKSIVISIVRDISEKVWLEREAQLNIFRGEENERARVAKELHDGIGPLLSTCKIYLHTMAVSTSDADIISGNKKIAQILDDALSSVREISNNLSPHLVKNFGLIHALKNYVEKVPFAGTIDLTCNYSSTLRFGEAIETSLYRVITELINNSVKYASAQNIRIEMGLMDDKALRILYKDDGVGFDLSEVLLKSAGHGLHNIRSRIHSLNGGLLIQSQPNSGMEATITLKT